MLFFNILFALTIVFLEHREPRSVWAWLMVLFFLPGAGFVLYLLFGMDMRKRKLFRAKEPEKYFGKEVRLQYERLRKKSSDSLPAEIRNYTDLIFYNMKAAGAMLFPENEIEIFADGEEKFNALLRDLEQAEHFIHFQYYIIRDDVLFQRIEEILKRKVAQGVRVRVLYDSMGCRSTRENLWKRLRGEGISVFAFFPAFLGRLQLRLNYRNHRKIVVIDNRVAYVGGFNVGKEYIGLEEKYGYWRDTHLRITGRGVLGLQLRFVLDWNYASKENLFREEGIFRESPIALGDCRVQVISSGPDTPLALIRDNYVRLISGAKRSICIQTPYFIPDEVTLNALLMAVRSGVEVNLMIPSKPDHPFVYWATYSYAGQLVNAGANCYAYEKGFIHCKGLVADGEVFCYGTANMDIRSFALNFETNVVVYSERMARRMEQIFRGDIKDCIQITREVYGRRSMVIRFKEQLCRLLSPLL